MDWPGDIKRQSGKKKRINWAGQKEICSQRYLYSSRNRYTTPHTPHPSRPLLQKAWTYVKQLRKSFFQRHRKSKCPSGGCIAWWRARRGIPSLGPARLQTPQKHRVRRLLWPSVSPPVMKKNIRTYPMGFM